MDTLKLERRGPVGWLINNRPDQLNAMNAHMRDEFELAWRALDADPEVRDRAHGRGRAFQTGVDVNEIATDGEGMQRYRESVEQFDFHFTAWHNEVWKPVITAVNGICAGGGFHWIADSDIVIAASDAQFFDPHVSIGQVVSIEAIGLMKRMPVEAVMRMAFVGRHERMSAPRAYELGMVSEVVDPPERLRDAAQELAEKIARNSPAAMAATKRACGARWSSGSPTRAGPARASSSRCGVIPIRRKARARSPRSASRTGNRSTTVRPNDRGRHRNRDHRLHRAPRRAGAGVQPLVRARPHVRGDHRRTGRVFRGARWVATRACKAVRPPGADWFGDPARGSFLTTVWVLDGGQAEWDAWVGRPDGGAARRARSHVRGARSPAHRGVPVRDRGASRRRTGGGNRARSPVRRRDRDGRGRRRRTASSAPRRSWAPRLPVAAVFTPERVILSEVDPPPFDLVLGFTAGDPIDAWRARVEPMLASLPAVGFASPFLRTIPGTDTYVDDL